MKVTGRMISSMVMEKKYGIVVLRLILESSIKARNKEKESSCGVMDHFMKVTLWMVCSMDMEYNTLRSSRRLILEALSMERLREKENSIGLTVENIMDNLEMGKKKVKEHSNSSMEINILVISRMARWMATQSI